jgi:AbrB family looped-hinge helix DNA binding protein
MKIKIDKAGRIVVPKTLREWLGFKPDTELEARAWATVPTATGQASIRRGAEKSTGLRSNRLHRPKSFG